MNKHLFSITVLLLISQNLLAQNDSIATSVIQVVKPYIPTVDDAESIKEYPATDTTYLVKKTVNYAIKDISVASTFVPEKGKALVSGGISNKNRATNYAALSFGNYYNVLAELGLSRALTPAHAISFNVQHHSSQSTAKRSQLPRDFYNTNAMLSLSNTNKSLAYSITGLYSHQLYNWHGVSYTPSVLEIKDLDGAHTYQNVAIQGHLSSKNSVFKDVSVQYNRFWDSYNALENAVVARPNFDLKIANIPIRLQTTFNYLSGTFLENPEENKYTFFTTAMHPSYVYKNNNWTVNLGAKMVYALENKTSKVYAYPKINASYAVFPKSLHVFSGLDGGLAQNSYQQLVQKNKFLAPTQIITPTNKQFEAFFGVKGTLSDRFEYHIKGSYVSEKNTALFLMDIVYDIALDVAAYQKINTFSVVYDDVSSLGVKGEFSAVVLKKHRVGLSANYIKYTTSNQEKPWNLPSLTAAAYLKLDCSEKWKATASVFYVGKQNDMRNSSTALVVPALATLPSYVDANARVSYHINEQFTAFILANNIANQAYEKWLSYPVQQLQIVGGVRYVFGEK